ncbi:hypothetical protein GP486_006728 [Trichoglossum hirsutum]|uniref:F-box domain-containing protein n=1 Tax=Trichoglossum hirsutum TaxID=265104 RepID=A0A9P8IJY2_9PEZI|nr:hypothetical protein GP486_006728 [Trichoglossum hirsutum]
MSKFLWGPNRSWLLLRHSLRSSGKSPSLNIINTSDEIFKHLQPNDLAKLALTSRALYAAVQVTLYRRPQVKSYHALHLFVGSLNLASQYAVAVRGTKYKWWREDRPLSKDVSELDITIDPVQEGVRSGGRRPTTVLIAGMIKIVVA